MKFDLSMPKISSCICFASALNPSEPIGRKCPPVSFVPESRIRVEFARNSPIPLTLEHPRVTTDLVEKNIPSIEKVPTILEVEMIIADGFSNDLLLALLVVKGLAFGKFPL